MRTSTDTKRILIFCLVAGCLCPRLAAGINLPLDGAIVSGNVAAVRLGGCEIRILDTYFWRDFMPIVGRPGPDGGTPLRARVKLSLDNSRGRENRFSLKAVIVDDRGQIYPVPFWIMEQGRMPSSPNLDREGKGTSASTSGAMWDGEIKSSEIREIVLVTDQGPYLPVGSHIHVELTWTDPRGETVVVRTPDGQIRRTD